jgi:hypothetical protein
MDDASGNAGGDGAFAPPRAIIVLRRRQHVALLLAQRYWRPILTAFLAVGTGIVAVMLMRLWTYCCDKATASLAISGADPNIATLNVPVASGICQATFRAPQLLMNTQPTLLPADEPAPLGVTVDGAPAEARVVICGFPAKSVFSAGHSLDEKTWTLPVSELTYTALFPPRGFVGLVRLAVVLMNGDNSPVDRRTLNLQWLPQAPSTPLASDASEVKPELEAGIRLKAAGNLPLARGIFRRYAQSDARAAFLLAETYDPISLARRELMPPDSDPAAARLWYRRAAELGAQEANVRLERLEKWTW